MDGHQDNQTCAFGIDVVTFYAYCLQFATLTPLEPRLIKKLLPPLTTLIQSTPAMSLLYECINGVIQGDILEGTDGAGEGEEIASLCVGKLRGMIVVEGDPNRELTSNHIKDKTNNTAVKYVALLAFNKIVSSYPHLVSMQQDVIMGCIDDPDISIRLQALDLSAGMVSNENLAALVERLMRQLRSALVTIKRPGEGRNHAIGVEPAADSDCENPEETLRLIAESQDGTLALPPKYRNTVIHRILGLCSKDTYSNITDFEWYIDILIQLVRLVPTTDRFLPEVYESCGRSVGNPFAAQETDASNTIGWELRNVAVRVSTVRAEAVKAANDFLNTSENEGFLALRGSAQGVLPFMAWIVGEYVDTSVSSYHSLESLIHPKVQLLAPVIVCTYLQAIAKVLTAIVSRTSLDWCAEHQTMISLLVVRVIHFLEPLAKHANLEVQELSVELLELLRVAFQAIISHSPENDRGPLFLTRALPQLFTGFELNAVAPTAQRKVPLPTDLNLGTTINNRLSGLLQLAERDYQAGSDAEEFGSFYNKRAAPRSAISPTFDPIPSFEPESSYQQTGVSILDSDALRRKRNARRERNKDDPFYIGDDESSSSTSTPFHEILRSTNGDDVDIESIPIMSLDLADNGLANDTSDGDTRKSRAKRPRKYQIAKDENIEQEAPESARTKTASISTMEHTLPSQQAGDKDKKSLLQVDSSGLGNFLLNASETAAEQLDVEGQDAQDAEMTRALAEVERLRLEMQRASERIQATDGTPAEGTMVKKKKKKKLKLKQPIRDIATPNGEPVLELDGDPIRDLKNADASPTVKRTRRRKATLVKPA